MVMHAAAQDLGSERQPARGEAIRIARPGVAARMVMGEKDARTSMECRIPDNGAQREIRTAAIAFMPGQMQAVRCGIHVRHPKALLSGIGFGEAAGKKCAGCRQSVQL